MGGRGDEPDCKVASVLGGGQLHRSVSKGHNGAKGVVSKNKVECGDELNTSADRDKGILQHVLAC